MARAYRRRVPGDSAAVELHVGNAAVLLALAFPLALDGPWVTAAWAAQGAVFFLLAPRLERSTAAVAGGSALLIAAACRAGFLDRVWYEVFPPVFNLRFLVGLLAVAAFAVGGHRAAAIEPARHSLRTSGEELRAALWFLGAMLLAVLLWAEPPRLWPSMLLAAETVALAALARRTGERPLAGATPVLAGILLARAFLADHSLARDAAASLVNRPLLACVAAAGAIALAGSWLRMAPMRAKAEKAGLALQAVSAAALLASLSAGWMLHQDASAREAVAAGEVARLPAIEQRKLAGLSVLWTLYAVAVLACGFLRSSRPARYAALGLLGAVVVKVFVVDLSEVQAIYRIVSFLVLGVVLLGVSAVYQRSRGPQPPPSSSHETRP